MKITRAAKLLSEKTHSIVNDNNDIDLLKSVLNLAFPKDKLTFFFDFTTYDFTECENRYGYCRHEVGNWADTGGYLKELKPIKLSEIESLKAPNIKLESECEFENIVEQTLNHVRETLIVKGKEYRRNNNPFHNFEVGARKKNITREKALDGMLLKHEVSIEDITNDLDLGILPTESAVNEKFGDALIYLIIKKAMLIDRIKKAE